MNTTLVTKKKIIFFDGDGTLWYPKKTKWTVKPHHVYASRKRPRDYLHHLTVTPGIVSVLRHCKKQEMILVALSTHPHTKVEADQHLAYKVKSLGLERFFDHVYSARPSPLSKGQIMKRVLKKLNIPKSKALLVGDSYTYDYLAAKKVGIECILLNTSYLNIPLGRKAGTIIKKWKQLITSDKN